MADCASVVAAPGGVPLMTALIREIDEETKIKIEPVALAGHREVVVRDASGRPERHFVIMCFASRWISGEPQLNEELADARWVELSELSQYTTTDGLAPIVAAAFDILKTAG